MRRFFIVANSFAAPFFSDDETRFIRAESPENALRKFRKSYDHPCGLYAANCYASADAYQDNEKALAVWRSNHVIALEKAAKDKGSYSYLGHGPGDFEIDGVRIRVKNPKHGRITKSA